MSRELIEHLKQSIVEDQQQAAIDGRGPIDRVVLEAKNDPTVLEAYRSFIASTAFVEFAVKSAEVAHSCRHIVRKLGLGKDLDDVALRRYLKATKEAPIRATLLFLLRDRGALPSFAELSNDKDLLRTAPHAWVELVSGLVTPQKLCQLMEEGIAQGTLPTKAVIFAFPRLRIAFGSQFTNLMCELKDRVPYQASKLICEALNRRYDMGTTPIPEGATTLPDIVYLTKSDREKAQRLALASGTNR